MVHVPCIHGCSSSCIHPCIHTFPTLPNPTLPSVLTSNVTTGTVAYSQENQLVAALAALAVHADELKNAQKQVAKLHANQRSRAAREESTVVLALKDRTPMTEPKTPSREQREEQKQPTEASDAVSEAVPAPKSHETCPLAGSPVEQIKYVLVAGIGTGLSWHLCVMTHAVTPTVPVCCLQLARPGRGSRWVRAPQAGLSGPDRLKRKCRMEQVPVYRSGAR
jgi:hypothetical protein